MTFIPQRLLCLVDLSQVSAAVLSWARLFAVTFRAQVEIFHAVWSPKMAEEEADISFDMLGTEIEGRVNALSDEVLGAQVKYVSTVVGGHPVKTILEHIAEAPPDLIVVGSHGYDGYGQVLLGSVAENMVRKAPCPTLIVKGPALETEMRDLKTIVCAVDLGEFSRSCSILAADLASMLDADLHVAFVAPPAISERKARSALEAWIPDAVWASGRTTDAVLKGDPGEEIVTYARAQRADLVVVAAEHRPFLEYTTLGRTTERVVRFCPCSAFVIPKVTGKPEFAVIEPAEA